MQNVSDMQPLTNEQYDKCKERALKRIQKRSGERPERRQFERELGRLWTVLDVLAGVVFVAALVVSSVHIIHHMGYSTAGYAATANAGTVIGAGVWANVHQWGYIALAEGSMLLFMVLFAMTRTWRRWLFVVLAFTAALFVVLANWTSGTGWLESIMPPLFTIGLGFHLEGLIVKGLERQQDVTDRYLTAMAEYEQAHEDATRHREYMPLLRQEIWHKLVSLKANRDYVDAPPSIKHEAVSREMSRETWAYEGNTPTGGHIALEGPGEGEQRRPFGSTRLIQEGPASGQPTLNGSGRGITGTSSES